MFRRHFLSTSRYLLAGGAAAALLACSSVGAQPRFTVSAEQLQQVVGQRFPRRYPLAGLLDLAVQPPVLRLLPEQNRLGALMTVEASGAALNRKQTGTFDLDFALRYEPTDRTLRAHQIAIRRVLHKPAQHFGTQRCLQPRAQPVGETMPDRIKEEVKTQRDHRPDR